MKKITLVICSLMVTMTLFAQKADYNVVPMPQSVNLSTNAPFVLNARTRIAFIEGNEEMERNAMFLKEYVQKNTGLLLALSTNTAKAPANTIKLMLDPKMTEDEGYSITVDNKGIIVLGKTPAGVFYGIQTLRKSLPTTKVDQVEFPAVKIADNPRFAYRGMMLDCGRHFFPVEKVKEFIDLIAMHNMNRFHWHLTEDQGWRIEIKKYPMLTAIGSVRKETTVGHNSQIYDGVPYGSYYTQDQARDIVEYARERYITVIPEIDMPGHQMSALAAMPELGCTGGPYEVETNWGVFPDILCMGNEKVYQFCEDVLSEIIDIFPSEMIHIGGDEAPKKRTADCPKCKALMEREGLNTGTIQSYFTNRIEKFVNSRGRRIMGWDEILEGDINKSATIHCWRGMEHGIAAAQAGHDVVMSPTTYCYLDYYQEDPRKSDEPQAIGGYLPLEKVYSMVSIPDDISPENRSHILGVQANLWTEYIPTPIQAEYMLLPRLAAIAEEGWCNKKGTYDEFLPRITRMTDLYDLYNMTYAKHKFPAKKVYKEW